MEAASEPVMLVPPDAFLADLGSNPELSINVGVGFPFYFPVLPYKEFCRLTAAKTLTWKNVSLSSFTHYKKQGR